MTSRHVTLQTGGQPNVNKSLSSLTTIKQGEIFLSFHAMVNFCAVFGCSNRSNREKNWSFYCLPAIITRLNDKKHELSRERRATWLARIRREDLASDPGEFVRVCSDHFMSGMLKNIHQNSYIG